jgi:hypothetical protein
MIGMSLAEMTIRTTAISLGKTSEQLTRDDAGALIERAQVMMAGVATRAYIEAACDEIRAIALADGSC